jgi:hypothetical protein
MFTQQISGTNNQQQTWGSQYAYAEQDMNTFWNQTYTGGGLIDLRALQAQAREASDQRLLGIALVMEALRMGTHTSIWGDVPYSEAASANPAPAFDPQQQVYATVQAKLDTAITALTAAGTSLAALPTDVVYNGNVGRWIRAANTLKARFHLHTAERLGAPAYQAALAAAQNGINEAPTNAANAIDGQGPGDFRSFRGNTVNVDANLWAQFLANRTDLTANQQFIDLLNQRNDPRLARYFALPPGTTGALRGANQFGANSAGAAVVSAPRTNLDFRQPIVTWTENQLILAEARFRTGDAAGALTNVNNVRTLVGLPALASVTLQDIAAEKYVSMFQNIEAWNDWKRLCFPTLTPGGPNNTSAAAIPGRLIYPFSEQNANANTPDLSDQPARNWNDPNGCT